MAENNKNINAPEEKVKAEAKETKAVSSKSKEKKANIFVRGWKKFAKLCSDTVGELKKVVWTSKTEVWKSFKLVVATVVGISIIIAVVDLASSWIINSIAGLFG